MQYLCACSWFIICFSLSLYVSFHLAYNPIRTVKHKHIIMPQQQQPLASNVHRVRLRVRTHFAHTLYLQMICSRSTTTTTTTDAPDDGHPRSANSEYLVPCACLNVCMLNWHRVGGMQWAHDDALTHFRSHLNEWAFMYLHMHTYDLSVVNM